MQEITLTMSFIDMLIVIIFASEVLSGNKMIKFNIN